MLLVRLIKQRGPCYNEHSPLVGGIGLLRGALVGVHARGFFSCANCEAAALALLGVLLIKLAMCFLKGRGIEPS